jgi:hypothetical protein
LRNGRLQQIAANRFSIPPDIIAILLQGLVRRPCYRLILWIELVQQHSGLFAQAESITVRCVEKFVGFKFYFPK